MTPYTFADLGVENSTAEEVQSFQALHIRPRGSEWQALPVRNLSPSPPQATGQPPSQAPSQHGDGHPASTMEASEPGRGSTLRDGGGAAVEASSKAIDPGELEAIRKKAQEDGHTQGQKTGYDEGFSAGTEEGKHQWDEKLARFDKMLHSMEDAQELLFQDIKSDLVRILTHIPEKILRRELSADPEAVVNIAESLISELPRQRKLIIRAHPDDLSLLEKAGLKSRDGSNVQMEADNSIGRGGLVLVTDAGDIEATIEGQLDRFLRPTRAWLTGVEEELSAPPNLQSPDIIEAPSSALQSDDSPQPSISKTETLNDGEES